MPLDVQFGTAKRLTATGVTVISSANAQIIGVMFNGTGTGAITIFAGVTATTVATTSGGAIICGPIIAYATVTGATVNAAAYFPVPAYCSGGLTVNLGASADPNVTIFWNPSGGA